MSLSGNLGFVSLDEILRLLTRAHQQGAVDVRGDGVQGRVFVGRSGVDLATTADDEGLRRALLHAGFGDETALRKVSDGETSLSAAIDGSEDALIALLREMTVESLYRMTRFGEVFQVYEDEATPFASPEPFELETIIADAKQRSEDWEQVSRTVKDLSAMLQLVRDLGDRAEVTVRADSWKVLSEIGGGASVQDIAYRLGTTEYWAARVAADLVQDGLVRFVGETSETVAEAESAPVWESTAVSDETAVQEPDPSESWWAEPDTGEPEAEPAGGSEPTAESEEDPFAPEPVEATEDDGPQDVEEDTEAFLEKVFSELGSEESQEEGHGLLRRRRLGAMRDLSNDS